MDRDRCSWQEWERIVWAFTIITALIIGLVVLLSLLDPGPAVTGGR